ncbi:MAG TPA: DRTGG domain-containing protein [Nitrospirota bacterium]|nr:DRTGG domain-containing protein [Nitrospirota bacterium]
MNLKDIVREFNLEVKTGSTHLDREVTGGYVSDLLSDVMAHADEGILWVTLHIHQNIVAVASHKGLSGIVLVHGRQPEQDTIAKAEEENIPILVSDLSAFELVGRLYKAGIRGAEAD